MGDSKEAIKECLLAAGCAKGQVTDFLKAFDEGDMKKAFAILDAKREELLDEYHACGKCIDRMDYLVYSLKKKGGVGL